MHLVFENTNNTTIGYLNHIGLSNLYGWIISQRKIQNIELIIEEYLLENDELCATTIRKINRNIEREDVHLIHHNDFIETLQSGFIASMKYLSPEDSYLNISFKVYFSSNEFIKSKAFRIENINIAKAFYDGTVPLSKTFAHDKWVNNLSEIFNKPGMRILEIGSREVVSKSKKKFFDKAEYIGFDLYAGDNVDIVGDAHKLSSYFKHDEKFDLIFSSAVFEHIAMPWIVAEEITKMLKLGGFVFCETHYSYSSHERPWHFFQFSEQALKVLFSKALGYECIEAGVSNPICGFFSKEAVKDLQGISVRNLYCHSEFIGRKVYSVENFDWHNVDISNAVDGTVYPTINLTIPR